MEFVLRVFLRSIALPVAAVVVTSFSISVDSVSAQSVDETLANVADGESAALEREGESAAMETGLELERTQLGDIARRVRPILVAAR